MMTRLFPLAVLLAGLAGPASATPTLRAEALVSDEIVRLGDLVDGAGDESGAALFRAPDFGLSGSLPAALVIEAARKAGVPGVSSGGVSDVAVIRVSRAVTASEIEAAVQERAATEFGASPADVQVTLDGDGGDRHLDPSTTGALGVTRFAVEPRSGKFEAQFGGGGRGAGLRVTGAAFETIEVATLVRPLARGDVLTLADLRRERRPKAQATDALDLEAAVGLAARRTLREGQTMRSADLVRPQYVERGAFVTLTYGGAGVSLSLKVRAMANGSLGDLVAVQNIQSRRVVNGVVTGPSQVAASAAPTTIARR